MFTLDLSVFQFAIELTHRPARRTSHPLKSLCSNTSKFTNSASGQHKASRSTCVGYGSLADIGEGLRDVRFEWPALHRDPR